jgi:hypothetical protein
MAENDTTPTGDDARALHADHEAQNQEPPKTFSQEDVNKLLAEEKRAYKKQMQDLKSKADEWDKIQEAAKSDLDRITGERDSLKTEAEKARIEASKLRALVRAGADPHKIDALIKRVVGATPEEIEADVEELKALGLLGAAKPSTGATGAGNPGLPPKQTEPDIDARIAEAEKSGKFNLATQLKLEKQRQLFKT